MKLCKCPKCGRQDCEVIEDEVDIGVGIQTFTLGFECKNCGQISVCSSCGSPDCIPHAKWCSEKK